MPRVKSLILSRVGAHKQKLKEVFPKSQGIEIKYTTVSLDPASTFCKLDKRKGMIYFLNIFGNIVP